MRSAQVSISVVRAAAAVPLGGLAVAGLGRRVEGRSS
jgi:hypothetical protein